MKVNSDDIDRYLTILTENSFDFDLKGYEIEETNYFRHGGNFHDTVISNDKMKSFLNKNENILKPLVEQYIKKFKQLKS